MTYKNEAVNANQIKPVVIGYQRTHYNGHESLRRESIYVHSKDEVKYEATDDLEVFKVKSKFRPVYQKEVQL